MSENPLDNITLNQVYNFLILYYDNLSFNQTVNSLSNRVQFFNLFFPNQKIKDPNSENAITFIEADEKYQKKIVTEIHTYLKNRFETQIPRIDKSCINLNTILSRKKIQSLGISKYLDHYFMAIMLKSISSKKAKSEVLDMIEKENRYQNDVSENELLDLQNYVTNYIEKIDEYLTKRNIRI